MATRLLLVCVCIGLAGVWFAGVGCAPAAPTPGSETPTPGGDGGGGTPAGGGDGGGTASGGDSGGGGSAPAVMTLTSIAFSAGGTIPLRYASIYVGGNDVSPPLTWSGLPAGTQQLALIVEDPDAFGFVHWVIYQIPATAGGLPEGIPSGGTVFNPAGAVQGVNGGPGDMGYYGPEPPPGETHHYRFTLYALDTALSLGAGLDASGLRDHVAGHILGQAELVGTFTP